MATKEELSEQLAITQKLSAAVDAMAKSWSKIEQTYETQIAAIEKLTTAIERLKATDLGALNNVKLDNLQGELNKTATTSDKLKAAMSKTSVVMGKNTTSAAAVALSAFSGLHQGLKNIVAMSKGVFSFFTGFIDAAANIAASIIAIPFKMFSALVDTAAAANMGLDELRQAIENLRKEMGDLKGPGTSAVLETTKTLQGFSDTGLSAYLVFGTMAERLTHVTKVAVAMGATFGRLTKEFIENGGALLAFQKGLGVTDEQMKAVGDRAITIGKPMTSVFMAMTKQTLALGKAFALDQKLIGKDMAKALQDVHHFGAITVKEIAQASVYARKLGLELDKIVGTLDAFETFDSAAENAAKLSQAFGVNIDAFKMMEAQSPAEQLEMLRKSFSDAGIDASKFTRQQQKLLSSTIGLDEATVRQAFSAQNYGASLDDVKKKSETAEKTTMSQAEAMARLADSIERMVKQGATQTGSFFDMFIKGFLGGVQSSKEFRSIIMNIKQGLQQVYYEGVRLGRAFVELFPGVKQFMQGIADFFRPDKFRKLAGGVTDVFIGWMKDLSTPGGKASFPDLMKRLQEKFFDFFNSQGPSGKKTVEGFKTIMLTISKVIASGIKWAADMVAQGLTAIIDLISGKKKIGQPDTKGPSSFLGQVLAPLGDALVHAWVTIAPKLWELVKLLGKKLFGYLSSDAFISMVKPAVPILFGLLFGPAVLQAVLGGVTVTLGKAVMGMITRALTGPGAEKEAAAGAKGLARIFGNKFGDIGKLMGPIGVIALIAGLSVDVSKGLDKFESSLNDRFGKTESKLGAAGAGVINSLTLGLLPEGAQQKIAESIAEMATAVYKAVEDQFGSEFTNALKEYVGAGIDVFGSLGDLIRTIFTGDEDKISDALLDVGKKLLIYLGKTIVWLAEQIPTLAVYAFELALRFQGIIVKTIGKLFEKGKDIPIIGKLFEALGKLFMFIGDGMSMLADLWKSLRNVFKQLGFFGSISKLFTNAWKAVKSGFSSLMDYFSSAIDSLKGMFWKVLEYISLPFRLAYAYVTGMWKMIGEFFEDKLKAVAKAAADVGSQIYDAFKGAFDRVTGIWIAIGTWYYNNVVKPVKDHVIGLGKTIVDTLGGAWTTIKETWGAIGKWFDENVVQQVTKLFVGENGEGGIAGAIKDTFELAWKGIKAVFSVEAVEKLFGDVVDAIKNKLGALADIPVFKDMIAIAKKTFEIGSPSKVFERIGVNIVQGMDNGMSDITKTVGDHMKDATSLAEAGAKTTASRVASIATTTSAQAAGADGLDSLVSKFSAVSRLSETTNRLKLWASSISKAAATVRSEAVAGALSAAGEIIKKANELDEQLDDGLTIDTPARLTKLATAVGLGGKYNYTIKSKDVVLNVNLSVMMNVDEVEKVMVLRKKSIIRDRINLAVEDEDDLPDNPNRPVILRGYSDSTG